MNLARILVLPFATTLACTTFAHGAVFIAGAGCDYATAQGAIDAAEEAPGADEVRIVANQDYFESLLVIDDGELDIVGGFESCDATEPNGATLISGAGAPASSVFAFSGDGTVRAHHLVLSDGDSSGSGGGILFLSVSGTLEIRNMSITGNHANQGGGIAALGPEKRRGALPVLKIGPNVVISNNSAWSGGGVYVTYMRLDMSDAEQSSIFLNHADQDGGGVYLAAAAADIGSGNALGTIFLNDAGWQGGGIYAQDGSDIRLFTTRANVPVRIDTNSADLGGAIALLGTDGPPTRATLIDAIVDGNGAGQGSGLYAEALGDNVAAICMRDRVHAADAGICADADVPDAAVDCDSALRCNRLSGSEVIGDPTSGAGASAEGLFATLDFRGTRIEDNALTPVLLRQASDSASGANLVLSDCEISGNHSTAGPLIASSGTLIETEINGCTIAGNDYSSTYVLASTGPARFTETIVWQPGKLVYINYADVTVRAAASMVLAHDSDSLEFEPGTVTTDDPLFVDAANGDFHLVPGLSPAIDFSGLAGGSSFDLDDMPRGNDDSEIVDRFGPRDLGAHETPRSDCIFGDGFEISHPGACGPEPTF